MNKGFYRDRHPVRIIPAAYLLLLLAAIVTALVATAGRNDFKVASNDPPPAGASGLARPHPPLDRAPGEPLLKVPSSVDMRAKGQSQIHGSDGTEIR